MAHKPDGTRWKANSNKQLQGSCAGLLTKAIDDKHGAKVTLRALLTADAVKDLSSLKFLLSASRPITIN